MTGPSPCPSPHWRGARGWKNMPVPEHCQILRYAPADLEARATLASEAENAIFPAMTFRRVETELNLL
jgi:hypothetical protein